MTIKAGHCSECAALVWRTAIAQRDDQGQGVKAGDVYLLWPKPGSVYSQEWTPTGYTVGIAWCPACAPEIGQPGATGEAVIGYETARDRYTDWFTDEKETFLRAWLADALGYGESEVATLLRQWREDRAT